MAASYEWIIEINDENGDNIDTLSAGSLDAFAGRYDPTNEWESLALCKESWSARGDGLDGRFYAYVVDGRLPDEFSDGDDGDGGCGAVPKRFKREFEMFMVTIRKG